MDLLVWLPVLEPVVEAELPVVEAEGVAVVVELLALMVADLVAEAPPMSWN